jgi:hypothetical protein
MGQLLLFSVTRGLRNCNEGEGASRLKVQLLDVLLSKKSRKKASIGTLSNKYQNGLKSENFA